MDIYTTDPKREEQLAHQRKLAQAKHKRQRERPLDYDPGLTILKAVGRYHYLTVAQVMRLTGWRAETYVNRWLKHLSAAGYLYDKNFIAESLGRPYGVWSILPKGRYALKERGFPIDIRLPYANKRDSDWLRHVRDLNDALMQFERLERLAPDWTLTGFRHDLELQRVATPLIWPDGSKHYFVPDGWVAIENNGEELCYCVEMDRGTEREGGKPWKEKIRSYTEFAKEPYQRLFGRERISVLIVIKSHHQTDQRRLENLLRWTEEELLALNRQQWGGMFRFTIQHADETDPRIFFGSPVWFKPFDLKPVPILEGVL